MRVKSLGLALAVSGLIATAVRAQVTLQSQDGDLVPTGKGWGEPSADQAKRRKPPPPPPANNGIDYHNGPILLGTIHVYFIWYGDWSGDTAEPILTDEIDSIGGTPWFNINTTYTNKAKQHISNSVALKGSTTDAYSRGTSLDDADIAGIVADAITSGRLPKDANGVYFVLTSKDVNETSGFCKAYCGWHTRGTLGKVDIKYAFVGSPAFCATLSSIRLCASEPFLSANENPAADGMASLIAHELVESATDPDLNAWYDSQGEECADKCEWTFGDIYNASNGARANVRWGARDFLIQRNWVNAKGGYCALAYP
jgi:hypothetical protein